MHSPYGKANAFVLCWAQRNKMKNSQAWDKKEFETQSRPEDAVSLCSRRRGTADRGLRKQQLLLWQGGRLPQTRAAAALSNSSQPRASVILIGIRVALSPSSSPSMGAKPSTEKQINLHNQPCSAQGSSFVRLSSRFLTGHISWLAAFFTLSWFLLLWKNDRENKWIHI